MSCHRIGTFISEYGGVITRLYLIEDDPTIRGELICFLSKYGYSCTGASDFENTVRDAVAAGSDLILLDLNLPYMDGLQICREIRNVSKTPIIVVTSRSSEFDELAALNAGADDFVTKPYNPQILLAHIETVIKRVYDINATAVLTYKGLTLDLLKSRISYQGKEIELTRNELCILRLLMQHPGNILPRDELISELWQDDSFVDENTLNVNIARLRHKLSCLGLNDYLTPVRHQVIVQSQTG